MKMKFQDIKEIRTVDKYELELSERAEEIDIKTENNLMREIISALKHTIEYNNIVSLSAPAIGYNKRIFCIKFDTEIKTFINPVITSYKGLQIFTESCQSIPGKRYLRVRNNDIQVIYQKPAGAIESRQIVGLSASVFQHEMDHLEGLLLSDIGLEIDDDFDNASQEEKDELINWYLDTLDLKAKELNTEIENDADLSQMKQGIDFMTSVLTGETKIENYNEV